MNETEKNKELIAKLKAGDKAVLKDLYVLYYSKLIGIGKKFNFDFLSPEDFVHETFLKLYHKRELLKEDVLLDKQLFVICKNIILNHIKKEKKNISFDTFDNLSSENIDSEPLVDETKVEEDKQQLYAVLNQLPEQQKQIFKLHKIEGYSYKEIKTITSLSPKTIANHIYLANKFLKKNIKK
ncbi:sigma-70 family RNA polymerase sigma factor [Galbibacter sp. EGI 63066]|uniref:RNA polymerase sigma factor n=1 Tax=Galbibacter sp. EGI 63066 TaxID=2993559 RepID=UPI0022491728|nr:sigma-70 family RNA polymerase sigma factor [Galbibacter sp. EGI 63066]MCX2682053.1 sigma-70 family RNA polymerase sigma factor [Galbibacter sp. EGI 63066]